MAVSTSAAPPEPDANPERGATPTARPPRRLRRAVSIVAGALAGLVLLAVGALLVIQFANLAGAAERVASRMLGRTVTVGSLRIALGAPITVDLADLRLANLPDGSRPDMVKLRRLTAEVAPWPLLAGRLEVRRLTLDAPNVMLERNTKDVGNWRFGGGAAPGGGVPLSVPAEIAVHAGKIDFRTTSGHLLHIWLENVAIRAAADQPVTLTAEGGYNALPIRLTATGKPVAGLRAGAAPYGVEAVATSLGGTLSFKGTIADPLGFDGVKGALQFDAPPKSGLMAAAGLPGATEPGLSAGGMLDHVGNAWPLAKLRGSIGPNGFEGTARLDEGARRQADRVTADLAFRALDLDALVGIVSGGGTGGADDLPVVEERPGTVGDVHLAAAVATWGKLRVSEFDLRGSVAPGLLAISDAGFGLAGAKARLTASAQPGRPGTRVAATASVLGGDGGQLARLLDAGEAGLAGRLDGRAALDMTGRTTAEALKSSHASFVIAMRDGVVSRALLEKAAIDLRSLLRKGTGVAKVACLLGVADLRNGAGPVSPLRLRTSEGTVVGGGQIDVVKRTLDITLRTDSATTGFFALDVPVRISGPLAAPGVTVALLPENRSPVTPIDLGRLPAELQQMARGNPCVR